MCNTAKRKINKCSKQMDIDKVFWKWTNCLNSQIIHRGEIWIIVISSSFMFLLLRNLQEGIHSPSQYFLPQDIEHISVFSIQNSRYRKSVLDNQSEESISVQNNTFFYVGFFPIHFLQNQIIVSIVLSFSFVTDARCIIDSNLLYFFINLSSFHI